MNKNALPKNNSDIKLAVCCLARDCARLMKSNITRINALQKYCGEMVVFVVENDSKDNTRALLEQWQRDASFKIHLPNIYEYKETLPDIDIDFSSDKKHMSGAPMYKTRVSRIAFARDCYLDALEKSGFVPDYIVMCDIDVYRFSTRDIMRTIFSQPYSFEGSLASPLAFSWDVALANGFNFHFSHLRMEKLYYDSFATELLDEPSEAHNIKVHLQSKVTRLLSAQVSSQVSSRGSSGAWLQVVSGFGGLGIYTYDAIFSTPSTKYIDAIITDDYQFCEHVSFHKMLIKKGKDKIYINPHLIVCYNTRLRAIMKRILQRFRLKSKK